MPDRSDTKVLAAMINGRPRPLLIGVDVDGTLSPIVAKPEQARLAPGARQALHDLTERVGVIVAAVSGRPLADLHELFELPVSVILIGSHGAEVGTELDSRTEAEQARIEATEAALQAVADRLPGSWVEHKPLAVALHVRQAEPRQASIAIAQLEEDLGGDGDLTLHRGHEVLEVAVRPVSKQLAFDQLRRRLEPATAVFIGDDASDEGVFESLLESDVAIKVGPGASIASERLASPTDVVELLQEMVILDEALE